MRFVHDQRARRGRPGTSSSSSREREAERERKARRGEQAAESAAKRGAARRGEASSAAGSATGRQAGRQHQVSATRGSVPVQLVFGCVFRLALHCHSFARSPVRSLALPASPSLSTQREFVLCCLASLPRCRVVMLLLPSPFSVFV